MREGYDRGMPTRCLALLLAPALMGCGGKGGGEDAGDASEAPGEVVDVEQDGPCLTDGDCSNGLACDGDEVCVDGRCGPGPETVCDDGDPCTVGRCDESEGGCVFDPVDADGDGYGAMTLPDGTACGGTDCDDGDDQVHPGADLDCGGTADLDCDTVPDGQEGYEVLVGPVQVTEAAESSIAPTLAWTGSQIAVAWDDGRDGNVEVYLARLAPDLSRVGGDVRITSHGQNASEPSLAWTGSLFALAWGDERVDPFDDEVLFVRVSEDGVKMGDEIVLSGAVEGALDHSTLPTVLWTGSEFGVGWIDDLHDPSDAYRQDVFFTRVSGDGAETGSEVRVTDYAEKTMSRASWAWTGSGYGVAWDEIRMGRWDAFFMLVDRDGAPAGARLALGTGADPHVAWTGSGFGVAYSGLAPPGGDLEIFVAMVTAAGELAGAVTRLTDVEDDSDLASISWSGEAFGVAWVEGSGSAAAVRFSRVQAGGAELGDDTPVGGPADHTRPPAVVWAGSAFAVAWAGGAEGGEEIWMALLGCR